MTNFEHPIAEQILDILKQQRCWFETFDHAPVRTSEEAAALRPKYSMEQGAKALIVRVKVPNQGKSFLMLVFPAHKRFDSDKLSKITGAKDIRFASEEEVVQMTEGVLPGGVPPFGNLFNLPVICDQSLFLYDKIIFNAGRTTSIAMLSKDYKDLVKPTVADIT